MTDISKRRLNIAYEGVMLTLVIVSVAGIFIQGESTVWKAVHRAVWVVFFIDVTARFIRALSKWQHLKKNPFDIISVIPLEDFFLFARFARFIKLFRYKNIIKRYLKRLNTLADKVPFTTVSLCALSAVLAIALITVVNSTADPRAAVHWTFRNFVQFNYQSDISQQNTARMITGIVLKVGGLLYMGLVLNRVLRHLEKLYEKHIKSRTKPTRKRRFQTMPTRTPHALLAELIDMYHMYMPDDDYLSDDPGTQSEVIRIDWVIDDAATPVEDKIRTLTDFNSEWFPDEEDEAVQGALQQLLDDADAWLDAQR